MHLVGNSKGNAKLSWASLVSRAYGLRPKELSVSALVWIAMGAALLPFVLLGSIGFFQWVQAERNEDFNRVQNSARALAQAIDRELSGMIETAQVVAGSSPLIAKDVAAFAAHAEDAAAKAAGDFILSDRTLRRVVDTSAGRVAAGSADSEIRSAFDQDKPIVGNVWKGSLAGSMHFAVHVPIAARGEPPIYVLSYVPRQDVIYDVVMQAFLPQGWLAAVVDGAGHIIARSQRNLEFAGTSASSRFLAQLKDRIGLVESVDLEQRPSVTSYHALERSPWRVAVWVPKSILQAPAIKAQQWVLALLAATLLTSLGTAYVAGRVITRPALRLVGLVKELERGQELTPSRGIMREANIVSAALCEAADGIRHRETRLRDSEAKFRNMADHAPVMVWVSEPDGARSFVSASWYEFTGMKGESALGRGWLDAVPPEDREAVERLVLIGFDQQQYSIEHRLKRCDDSYAWVLNTARPRFGDDGELLGFIGSVTDITERKQIEAALRDSEERTRLALDAGGMGTWSWRLGDGRIEADDKTLDLLGMTGPNAQSDGERILSRVHPDDRLGMRAAVDAAVADNKPYNAEFRVVLPGGESRWLAGRGRTERDHADAVGIMRGVTYDITARKRREEENLLLLREVDHRAKNMLTLVLAVARQTSAATTAEFVNKFTERVQSLSASQDLLVRSDWQGASLDDLVRAQLAPVTSKRGDCVRTVGPSLMLLPSAAQAIGMALHELATNASLYGALSSDTGRVEIDWNIEQIEPLSFVMRWREIGGPRVEAPLKQGFGSTVVSKLIRISLQGQVNLSFEPEGLLWQLRCPAEMAIDMSSIGISERSGALRDRGKG